MRQYRIFQTPEELGKFARSGRKAQKLGLREAAPQANVGPRFLSEFERGKPTAELAKVISAVHAAGLDFAVVKRAASENLPANHASYYSKLVDTEFPYDWSNRQMSVSTFIQKVLKAARFNDMLKIVSYFGFDTVSNELPCLENTALSDKVISILLRIQKGMLLAHCQRHDSAS